jgi:hypothetical protein
MRNQKKQPAKKAQDASNATKKNQPYFIVTTEMALPKEDSISEVKLQRWRKKPNYNNFFEQIHYDELLLHKEEIPALIEQLQNFQTIINA